MEAVITQENTVEEMAEIIFNFFVVNQSCKVVGTVMNETTNRLLEKGKAVLMCIEELDRMANMEGTRRVRKKVKDAVGGDLAHKIFRYQRRIVDEDIRYTIWRIQ